MSTYFNRGNDAFQIVRNSEYVDKSGLIAITNSILNTEHRFACVSRSRRFGKSMAAKMLNAYYDQSCDSLSLFADLSISSDPSFKKHLNKYTVIYVDMTDFVTQFKENNIVENIKNKLYIDLQETFPDIKPKADYDFMDHLMAISGSTGQKFILLIDEWDAILREFGNNNAVKDQFVDLLRRMFKSPSSEAFALVYMTGILPIKKYKTQSALNNFTEYSMVDPRRMACFFGFTKDEVKALSIKYGMDLEELERWYDGYKIGTATSMFNPNSVIQALDSDWCTSYWAKTAAYDTVLPYINMNFEGLKDNIINMLAGGRCKVNTSSFQNDMSDVRSKDDVLTLLIHLGYLSFDRNNNECYVPNHEVSGELRNAVENTGWGNVVKALKQSDDLLQATLDGDEEAVAIGVDLAHDENSSILSYNNENSLACVLSIAYYYAKNDYVIHREFASGKGFADLVMIPRKNVDSPTLLIELKYNQDAVTAISQIKKKQYPAKLKQYSGNLLLVGINYDKETKTHSCRIEKA